LCLNRPDALPASPLATWGARASADPSQTLVVQAGDHGPTARELSKCPRSKSSEPTVRPATSPQRNPSTAPNQTMGSELASIAQSERRHRCAVARPPGCRETGARRAESVPERHGFARQELAWPGTNWAAHRGVVPKPEVKMPAKSSFQGGGTGSNPVGGAPKVPDQAAVRRRDRHPRAAGQSRRPESHPR
jgi:hypothetical protein